MDGPYEPFDIQQQWGKAMDDKKLQCPADVETATKTFDPAGYDPNDCAGCGCSKEEHSTFDEYGWRDEFHTKADLLLPICEQWVYFAETQPEDNVPCCDITEECRKIIMAIQSLREVMGR